MDIDGILDALLPLIDALDYFGIAYHIGGSLASSAYGISRPTQDADVVADISSEQVLLLVKRLKAVYYIDADMIRDAIRYRSSFNIIHLETMFKIDVFIPKSRPYAQQEAQRASSHSIEDGVRPLLFLSPEDVILNKLEWYRMGGEISQRQWNDVLGIIKRQWETMDWVYLERWAKSLQVDDLLSKATDDAEL